MVGSVIICLELFILLVLGVAMSYSWVLEKVGVSYRILIIAVNSKNEILLVFNSTLGSLSLPSKTLLPDETPTMGISSLLKKYSESTDVPKYIPHPLFHSPFQKFDRVRDDIGPIYISEYVMHKHKCCDLFYVFFVDSKCNSLEFRIYPYPEFYDINFIRSMDTDTKIPDIQMKIINEVMSKINLVR